MSFAHSERSTNIIAIMFSSHDMEIFESLPPPPPYPPYPLLPTPLPPSPPPPPLKKKEKHWGQFRLSDGYKYLKGTLSDRRFTRYEK